MTDLANRPRSLVVGAGIVGLCTAYHLHRAGHAVTVVDTEEPGNACSSGNAGSISIGSVVPLGMPGVLSQAPRMLLDPNGPLSVPPHYWLRAAPWLRRFVQASTAKNVEHIALALHRLVSPALNHHRRIMRDLGGLGLIQESGQLQLYPDEASVNKDRGGWKLREQYGVRAEKVGVDRIRELEPAVGPLYTTGYFLPDHAAVINPGRQARLIADQLQQRGVSFIRDEIECLILIEGSVRGARSAGGTYEAAHTVICAGAWSQEIIAPQGYALPLESQRGYHLEFPNSNVRLNRTVVAADRKIFVTDMEDGLRAAGTVEFGGLERPANVRRALALQEHVQRLLPSLRIDQPPRVWMGHRPCMPDSLPVIGASRHAGLWFNFGHGHLGLTMSAFSGYLTAQVIQGLQPDIDLEPYTYRRF